MAVTKAFIEKEYENDFLLLWRWYQSHWNEYAKDVLRVDLEPKQKQLLTLIQNNERVEATCCHGAGKTFVSSLSLLIVNSLFPFSIGITTAPSFRQVEKLFWSELGRRFYGSLLPTLGFPPPNTTMWNIAPGWFSTGESSDTPAKIEGFHSPTAIFYIVDEAKAVPDPFFESIEGGMNAPISKQLRITTPGPSYGEAYECTLGKKKDKWQHLHISAWDVPRLHKWAKEKKEEWGPDSPIYRMRVLGEYVDEAMSKIFTARHLRLFSENCARGKIDKTGKRVISADIGGAGIKADLCVFTYRMGNYIVGQEKFAGKRTDEISKILINRSTKFNADQIIIDAISMGVGVYDNLLGAGLADKAVPFKSLFKANEDIYENLKTEVAYYLRMQIEAGVVGGVMTQDLSTDLFGYDSQLTSKGKYKLVDPNDSPDFGDSLIMAFSQDNLITAYVVPQEFEEVAPTDREIEVIESFEETRARYHMLREAKFHEALINPAIERFRKLGGGGIWH